MIKLNLVKIGAYGSGICALIVVAVFAFIFFSLPNAGESAMIWMTYALGIGVLAKFGFFFFIIMFVLGLSKKVSSSIPR